MKSKLAALQRRVAALERMGGADVVFLLVDGSRAGMRRKRMLDALCDAIEHRDTPGARIMLRARRASDGSHLHEICQALRAGPVPPGEVNEEVRERLTECARKLTDDELQGIADRLENPESVQ